MLILLVYIFNTSIGGLIMKSAKTIVKNKIEELELDGCYEIKLHDHHITIDVFRKKGEFQLDIYYNNTLGNRGEDIDLKFYPITDIGTNQLVDHIVNFINDYGYKLI